jgi:hypothetical protein
VLIDRPSHEGWVKVVARRGLAFSGGPEASPWPLVVREVARELQDYGVPLDDAHTVHLLREVLTGPALAAWNALTPRPSTWGTATAALEAIYWSAPARSECHRRLAALRVQGADIRRYVNTFNTLAQAVHDGIKPDALAPGSAIQLMDQFVAGLPAAWKDQVRALRMAARLRHTGDRIDELQEALIQAGDLLPPVASLVSPPPRAARVSALQPEGLPADVERAPDGVTEAEVVAAVGTLRRAGWPLTGGGGVQQRGAQERRAIVCWYCAEAGHAQRTCPRRIAEKAAALSEPPKWWLENRPGPANAPRAADAAKDNNTPSAYGGGWGLDAPRHRSNARRHGAGSPPHSPGRHAHTSRLWAAFSRRCRARRAGAARGRGSTSPHQQASRPLHV